MNEARSVSAAPLTRRRWLQAAGTALMAPAVIPSSALGRDGATSPSERIVAGGIGLGGRGTGDLHWMLGGKDVQFVAVCDVSRRRREAIKATVAARHGVQDCATYRDLRQFLAERDDIEAVLIATGDRWHTLASILAMRAGKDVYCEKPGSLTIAEGRELVETARSYGRIFQTGTQRLSQATFVFATELARTGRLGELHTVRAHLWPRVKDVTHNAWLPAEPLPPKDKLDWDLWLGPVPWRPYNRRYLGGCGAWGVYWGFAAGIAGWGSHTIIQCQFAAGAEDTSPVEYVYPGNRSGDGLVARFANGVKLVMQFKGWRGSCGVTFEGSEGRAAVADGYAKPDLSSPALMAERKKVMTEYLARSQRPMSHMRDFLDCVRSRRQTIANPEAMHRSMTTNHAINLCLALGRDLTWDPEKEEFVGDPEANRMRARAVRQPWLL
ncbi:MAG: Gfo/Idh/MocA family protein [Planctomycetota bacterium]